jgi:hypothetical protein
MPEKILLSKYFKDDAIVAKEDQLELKPSAKGLIKLKKKFGIGDWQMLYIGDGHDDYLAAKGANVFFAMIAQGLVNDINTVAEMKKDADFGADLVKIGRSKFPKFLVAFNYDELVWWFKENGNLSRKIKAVCFDLGDTLVVGGREEAYTLTDKNWPTWEVDKLLEDSKINKKLKEDIMKIRIENKWRRLGELPAMNSSEVRIASVFLMTLFCLKERDMVSALYSEVDKKIRDTALSLAKKSDIALNTETVPDQAPVKDLATLFPPPQFLVFLASSLLTGSNKKNPPTVDDLSLVLRASFIWIAQYRKYELETYREHCKIPSGLPQFLELLSKRRKKLGIFTSKSRKIVETALAYEKEISRD